MPCSVTVLAPPDRDAHYLEARPSMMAALRRADLVVAVGAELEVGWLPAALQGAHNPNIQVGRQGYFEGAAHTNLIQVGGAADRAMGDVHPAGNPHYYFDALKMAEVAEALAVRLGELAPEHAERFEANAAEFAEQAREYVRALAGRVPRAHPARCSTTRIPITWQICWAWKSSVISSRFPESRPPPVT
jgi:zinc/manganese transport system substrate-binding protein